VTYASDYIGTALGSVSRAQQAEMYSPNYGYSLIQYTMPQCKTFDMYHVEPFDMLQYFQYDK